VIRQMPTVTSHAMRFKRDIGGLLSRTPMTTALTPALALDYVRELSTDVLAGVVLDAHGTLLAGDHRLADAANALLAAAPNGPEIEGSTEHGKAFAATNARHSIVVATGPFALARVTRRDLRTALSALGGETPPDTPSTPVPEAVTAALVAAARDAFRRNSAVSRSD
jgi:hypothetical protein